MKKFITAICTALAIFAFSAASQAKTKAVVKEVTYLTSIHCDKCAKKITENVSFEKGVKNLTVDVGKKTVTIKYDASKTDAEKLAAAIRKLGYTAEVVPAK